jgi:hypothetical protein
MGGREVGISVEGMLGACRWFVRNFWLLWMRNHQDSREVLSENLPGGKEMFVFS